ncbi:MAG: HypC/HybG/HupF family hydrogenase formation chaperone [Nitrospinae bacterium CG11_big_fil_rev_8_21_14_0_20_56_8]|nr:MAG: HypC/HybG/HupF family hydrogenase formation chaperone [Nitrospinae bacterium CG11_big_fil_rev_8_21_14_0_20_56_8]
MCLAVPGQIMEIVSDNALMPVARVSFAGVTKEVNLAYTPEARVGDFVIVHVGFAISVLDPAGARRVFDTLREIAENEIR